MTWWAQIRELGQVPEMDQSCILHCSKLQHLLSHFVNSLGAWSKSAFRENMWMLACRPATCQYCICLLYLSLVFGAVLELRFADIISDFSVVGWGQFVIKVAQTSERGSAFVLAFPALKCVQVFSATQHKNHLLAQADLANVSWRYFLCKLLTFWYDGC